jgi:MFS family permease
VVERRRGQIRAEVAEGFRETFRNRYLLAFAGEAATYNVAWSAIDALLVLWAVRELGLSAATLGLLLSVGSVGALLGALLTDRLARRIGVGRAMWTSAVVSNAGVLLIPAAAGDSALVLAVLGIAFFLRGLGMTGTNVHTYAIRQAVTPVAMLGRSSAAYRVLTYGFIPLGALLGGLLGETLGLRPALLVAALLLFPSWCWLYFSPARSLRDLPTAPEDRR